MRGESDSSICRLGVAFGNESMFYSFPNGHPLNNSRTKVFASSLRKLAESKGNLSIVRPIESSEEELLLFHTQEYVDFVKASSKVGTGYLDYGDTPSFKGVFEASLFAVGASIEGLKSISEKKFDHFFNPVGGLHHARRDRAGGFCVFNDAAIVMEEFLSTQGDRKVAYVDIDCHQGDGVYYAFEQDPRVIIADIHEDGRFIYPGTGSANESGMGRARGTKLNIPLEPNSGDEHFFNAFDRIMKFLGDQGPLDFIFFQCGADGLAGDPLTHLQYSKEAHAYATKKLHRLAHDICDGRILAMGGGGYNPRNVNDAWIAVVQELTNRP